MLAARHLLLSLAFALLPALAAVRSARPHIVWVVIDGTPVSPTSCFLYFQHPKDRYSTAGVCSSLCNKYFYLPSKLTPPFFPAPALPPPSLALPLSDLGLDDLALTGFGSEIKTPTLNRLAKEGSVLSNYYVNPICTPTRASFMTGRYPIHLGLQSGVIRDAVPDGVPLNETMVPVYLRQAGYKTHSVGKWHLGFHHKAFTPEARGFDTSMGYYTGNCEYWNHTSPCWQCGNFTALDLHRATASTFEPITDASMKYSTELFGDEIVDIIERHEKPAETPLFVYAPFEAVHGASSCYVAGKPPNCQWPDSDELQAPDRFIAEQSHIERPDRRTYAGMLGAVDEAVANITAALARRGMLNDTLVLVTTDNVSHGSNGEPSRRLFFCANERPSPLP